jgi:hypothetical protein
MPPEKLEKSRLCNVPKELVGNEIDRAADDVAATGAGEPVSAASRPLPVKSVQVVAPVPPYDEDFDASYFARSTPVSYATFSVPLAVFTFPAGSVNVPIETVNVAVPDDSVVGVYVAVYVVPDPDNVDNVPPVVVMSLAAKSVADSDNVNEMVAVCPAATVPEPERVMEIVGAVVSTV